MTNHNFSILNSDNKTYLARQILWIEKQLQDFKGASFKNSDLAREEFDRGMLTPMSPPKVIHAFREEFLSEEGMRKLNTTLKVFKKRELDKKSKCQKVEIILDYETKIQLLQLVNKSSLTQAQVITQLIKSSHRCLKSSYAHHDFLDPENTEEQLEITL